MSAVDKHGNCAFLAKTNCSCKDAHRSTVDILTVLAVAKYEMIRAVFCFRKQVIKVNPFCYRYDHLRKEGSDFKPCNVDQTAEPWRAALETTFTNYVHEHYKQGVTSIYGSSDSGTITLVACIESHQFNSRNYW